MTKRYCHTCAVTVNESEIMGCYWKPEAECKRVGCDARFNIDKERTAWREAQAAAGDHRGPKAAPCAVCGEEIGAYETRQYGKTGAVHIWKPGEIAKYGTCYRADNKSLYPFHYTDG